MESIAAEVVETVQVYRMSLLEHYEVDNVADFAEEIVVVAYYCMIAYSRCSSLQD